MDDFNRKLDRIQREFEALRQEVKAQNAVHLQSLAEQRTAVGSAFEEMSKALEEAQSAMGRGCGQVHAALWRHELLLKDVTVRIESRFSIAGDVMDMTRSHNAQMEQRWADLEERVRRLEQRQPPAA